MQTGILFSVGAGGRNTDIDTETIQKLLNRVPLPVGPPQPLLAEDGDCGPLTIAAISRFQTKALGFSDGLVEPNRKTHGKLSELAGGFPDIPMRVELAEGLLPIVRPMVINAISALDALRANPALPGRLPDITREALAVHFLLAAEDLREDRIGRVLHRFNSINVDFDHRNIFWRPVTIKQAKLELNQRVTAKVPPSYVSFNDKAAFRTTIPFTPNYKPFDGRDGLGYGPQMLGYKLIVAQALKSVSFVEPGQLLESDSPGFPGADFDKAVDNPAAYGSFAFHLNLGFAQPLGDKLRTI